MNQEQGRGTESKLHSIKSIFTPRHKRGILLIVLLVLLLVINSHANREVLTSLASADVVCFVFGHPARSFVIGGKYRSADYFISLRMILIIVPLDTLNHPAVAFIVYRGPGAFYNEVIIGIVIFF